MLGGRLCFSSGHRWRIIRKGGINATQDDKNVLVQLIRNLGMIELVLCERTLYDTVLCCARGTELKDYLPIRFC